MIEVPVFTPRILELECTVPDGGTLLINGGIVKGEIAPISDATAVKALGEAVAAVQPVVELQPATLPATPATRGLLILIKPTLIIHRELEDDESGPGYVRPTGLPPLPAATQR